MPRPRSKRSHNSEQKKQQLIERQTTAYKPTWLPSVLMFQADKPMFSIYWLEKMLYDPQVSLGLAIIKGPMFNAIDKIKVESKDQRVAKFVTDQLKRFWETSLAKVLRSIEYGVSAGEILYRRSGPHVEFDMVADFHPLDAKPLTQDGDFAGIRVTGNTSGAVDIMTPKAWWNRHDARYSSWFGRSRLRSAYDPWYEKWSRGGAVDIRKLWFHKNAFWGGILRHPPGGRTMPDGSFVDYQDVARQILELWKTGGVLTLPNDLDDSGKPTWDLKEPTINGSGQELREYPKDLDIDIIKGLGIPPEVVQSQGTGTFGRGVPAAAFYSGLEIVLLEILRDFRKMIADPLIELNFGEIPEYAINSASLLPEDPGQGQGMAGGSPGGPGGGTNGSSPGGNPLAGLFGGGQSQQRMSLGNGRMRAVTVRAKNGKEYTSYVMMPKRRTKTTRMAIPTSPVVPPTTTDKPTQPPIPPAEPMAPVEPTPDSVRMALEYITPTGSVRRCDHVEQLPKRVRDAGDYRFVQRPKRGRPAKNDSIQMAIADLPDRSQAKLPIVDAIIEQSVGHSVEAIANVREQILNRVGPLLPTRDVDTIMAEVRAVMDEYLPIAAGNLSDATLAAWVFGADDIHQTLPPALLERIARPPAGIGGAPPVDAMGSLFPEGEPRIRLPLIDKAAQDIADRTLVTRDQFDSLSAEARRFAFTVSDVDNVESIGAIRNAVLEAITQGDTLEDFREKLDRDVFGGATPLHPARVETVFRTNVQTAYARGLDDILDNPMVSDEFPYVSDSSIHDGRRTPICEWFATAGIGGSNIYRRDDPLYRQMSPPRHFSCRTGKTPLSISDAAARGVLEAQVWIRTGQPPENPYRMSPPPPELAKMMFPEKRGGVRLSLGAETVTEEAKKVEPIVVNVQPTINVQAAPAPNVDVHIDSPPPANVTVEAPPPAKIDVHIDPPPPAVVNVQVDPPPPANVTINPTVTVEAAPAAKPKTKTVKLNRGTMGEIQSAEIVEEGSDG